MAISLGSLYVELKANTAQFLDGMSKASVNAKAFGRDLESSFSKVGALLAPLGDVGQKLASVFDTVGSSARGAFTEMGKSGALLGGLAGLAGVATAAAGGLFALAGNASEVGAKIYDASEKTGIGAAQLSGLMAISKETGGDFDSLMIALARASVNLEKTAQGAGKLNPELFAAMGGVKGAALQLKPMGDELQTVLQRIFATSDGYKRNRELSDLLSRGWMQNVEVLKLLATQGYAPAIAEARKLGIYFDDASARQAKGFQIAVREMTGELSGLALEVGKSVLPAMKDLFAGLHSMGGWWEAQFHRMGAVMLALTGQWGAAKAAWSEATADIKASEQAETDFLLRVDNLTEGQKAAGGETAKLTGGLKAHADALAELIARERDELSVLAAGGSAQRQALLEYDRSVTAIQKAIDKGGSYKEGLEAQALALDIYNKKLDEYNEKILAGTKVEIPKLPWLTRPGVAPEPPAETAKDLADYWKPPELAMPGIGRRGSLADFPGAVGSMMTAMPRDETLSQLAKLRSGLEETRPEMKSLKLETQLTDEAFAKLTAAFPNWTEAQVVANAAGRRYIDTLTKMDKFGDLSDHFREFSNNLISDGDNLSGKLLGLIGAALDQLEDKIAKLAVTGKRINFREIGQGLEESVVKAGEQKVVGTATAALGRLPGLGGLFKTAKRDGSSAANALYVILASAAARAIGGPTGEGIAAPTGEGTAKPGLPNLGELANLMGNIFGGGDNSGDGGGDNSGDGGVNNSGGGGSATPGVGALLSLLPKLLSPLLSMFGGGLQGGGDVTPGRAYVVGERHPEFFLPRQTGAVVPSLAMQQVRPLSVIVHQHINTPDADSFRRSQSQIASEAHRAITMAHARNS